MTEITMHAPRREFIPDPDDTNGQLVWMVYVEAMGTDGRQYTMGMSYTVDGVSVMWSVENADHPATIAVHHQNLRRALENQMRNAGAWPDVV